MFVFHFIRITKLVLLLLSPKQTKWLKKKEIFPQIENVSSNYRIFPGTKLVKFKLLCLEK